MARAIRLKTNIPLRFWGLCVKTAVYIINRLPSSGIGNISPFEKLYNKKTLLQNPRVFGFEKKLHETNKLQSRSVACVLIGYTKNKKGYLLYDLTTYSFLAK